MLPATVTRGAKVDDAVAIGHRALPEHLNRFVVVKRPSTFFQECVAGDPFRGKFQRHHPVLDVLMRNDRGAIPRIGELKREE
jgi:hypothetical protein